MVGRNIKKGASISFCLLLGAASSQVMAEKILRIVPSTDLKIIDPIWSPAFQTRDHGYMIYDTLFAMDSEDNVHPQMVDEYEVSEDEMIWKFKLREGLKFHNGNDVTADDVVESLNRWGKRDILGTKLYDALDEIVITGTKTFEIRLAKPFGQVLDALAKDSPNVPFIMPKEVAKTPPDEQISNTIGSGPFTLDPKNFQPGDRITYYRNQDYVPRKEAPSNLAGGKNVNVDRVEWVFLSDAETRVNALLKNEVDLIQVIPPTRLAELHKKDDIDIVELLPKGLYSIHFNHIVPPFNDKEVLRAASLAVDQYSMLKAQMFNDEAFSVCPSIYACDGPYGNLDTGYFTGKAQLAEAKKVLEQSGYKKEKVVIIAPTDASSLDKMPVVYAELLRRAGFNVELQQMDTGSWFNRRANKETADKGGWSAYITFWDAGTARNPAAHPGLRASGLTGNFGWPTDEALEAARAALLETTDSTERRKLAEDVQLRSLESGVLIPGGEFKRLFGVRDHVNGLLPAAANIYWNVTVD